LWKGILRIDQKKKNNVSGRGRWGDYLFRQLKYRNKIQHMDNNLNIKYDIFFNLVSQLENEFNSKKELEYSIDKYKNNIKQANLELIDIKPNIIESLLKTISFGIVNFDDKYKNIQKNLKNKILTFENELADCTQKVNNQLKSISNLETTVSSHIKEFCTPLLSKQSELKQLANNSYINDYKRVFLMDEISLLISGKKIIFNYVDNSLLELKRFYFSSEEWTNNANEEFVISKKKQEKHFLDTLESKPLTSTQRDAVITNENNNLILAGAGSGKTSVVVAKTIYLIKEKIVNADEVLILAFNKNAQEELTERFLKYNINIEVKTFHSFGLSIIGKAYSRKPDLCKISESPFYMTKFINETIANLSNNDEKFVSDFVHMLAYFKIPHKEESTFKSKGEYYDYQKNYDIKTLQHKVYLKNEEQKSNLITLQSDIVKSYQELLIGNFLTLNGIAYIYEDSYKFDTATGEKRQYKPDFYLPEYDIYIEHYGIDKNGNTALFVDKEEYNKGIEWKRETHKLNNTRVIETYSYEHSENKLLNNLKVKLSQFDVQFRNLTHSEMLDILNLENKDNWFTKIFATFLNHFKSNMYKIDDIRKKASVDARNKAFFMLFERIYIEYIKYQKEHGCIDFDDMIVEAITAIEKGLYSHNYKHIFIDEFQDISTTRALLIKKLISLKETSITAVGDDWQSINKFAGSNIQIIQKFKENFGASKTVALDYTFRFDDKVSKVASSFIQKNPNQLKKVINTIKKQDENKFSILIYWAQGETLRELEAIIQLIQRKEKNSNLKIMVLSRYRYMLEDVKKGYVNKSSNLDIVFSTVHSSKGNEADYVIVLNVNNGKMGFPSKIEDDPILNLVVPEGDEFIDAEERRLFYVALTRTKKSIFLLSNYDEKSDFIDELLKDYANEIFIVNNPSEETKNCPDCKTGILKKRHNKNDKNFYGCSNFPRCNFTEDIKLCPKCKSEIFKNNKTNKTECSNTLCDFSSSLCNNCGGYMIERSGRNGVFLGCSNYPKCKNTI
jgi:DNA helicase-4